MLVHPLQWRNDLIVCRQGDDDRSTFVIKDPSNGRYFRLKEIEHFIARQMDGATSLEELRRRVEEQFGGALPVETLERFVERLHGLGLLREARDGAPPARRPAKRVAGDLFYLRINAFDPDRFFSWLLTKVGFFMTPWFVVSSACLIAFAVGLTVLNWMEITRAFVGLLRWESLLLMWIVVLAIIGAHECAHGLTCKRFGGRVHEIGFLLLYFQPAFYCNVSDAWLFPEKSKRLWVTFAGAYFELFLWALSTVIWRITDPATPLNHVALIISATSGIKTLFNLNPLIKLDGYYLLSDWLEIPNLRQKAFAHLGNGFRRLVRLGPKPLPIPARERRVYLVYGILAGVYTYWLLGWIASKVGGFLVARFEAWGFALFAFLVAGLFRRPIGRTFCRLKETIAKPSQRLRSAARLAKIVLGLGVVGLVLFFCRIELKVSGEFAISPIHNADVRATVEGIIQDVFYDEGALVRQGDVIARLRDRDTRVELGKIRANIRESRAKLSMLRAGPRSEEIELARALVVKAEQRLKYAQNQFERDQALFGQALLSPQAFEVIEEEVSVRKQELEEARSRLKVLLAGSRPEEIEALEAELSRFEAQQVYLEEQLELLQVVSPASGVITTRKLKEKAGQFVERGDLIAEIHELDVVTAEISILEKDIADVEPGHKVILKARAFPGLAFEGTVTAIAPIASKHEEFQETRTVLVITRLENQGRLLKSDMSGRAKIYCGQRRALELLGRRLVRYLRVEFWSWW